MNCPVWITGRAQISAMGRDVVEFTSRIKNPISLAQSRLVELPGLDPAMVALYACDDLPIEQTGPSKLPLDRSTALALHVVGDLLKNVPGPLHLNPNRLGLFWGSGMAGAYSLDLATRSLYADQRRIRPSTVITAMPNAPAAELGLLLGARGPCITYATACASSAVAIGEAMLAIQTGRVDIAIVGGSESMLSPGILASWHALRVLASTDQGAATACRPFDQERTGFALGEGAAAFVLESAEHAKAMGRYPLARLSGYATNSDSHHITNPDSAGQTLAMQTALHHAQLKPSDIAYVNAHGTATRAGDLAEAHSIANVFGSHAVPVSSSKSLHGHLLGAGGAVELNVALDVLLHGWAPHTVNLSRADPLMHLDLVTGSPRLLDQVAHVMSNSFAFGGTNAVLIASQTD